MVVQYRECSVSYSRPSSICVYCEKKVDFVEYYEYSTKYCKLKVIFLKDCDYSQIQSNN